MRIEITVNRNPLEGTFYKRIGFDYPTKGSEPTKEEIVEALESFLVMEQSETIIDSDDLYL